MSAKQIDFIGSLSEESLHSYYHMALKRGLNEGLADFWGWMYTGDPDFIAQSIPAVKESRSLKASNDMTNVLPDMNTIKDWIEARYLMLRHKQDIDGDIVNYAYTLATSFSRFMKSYTDIYAQARGIDLCKLAKISPKSLLKLFRQSENNLLIWQRVIINPWISSVLLWIN